MSFITLRDIRKSFGAAEIIRGVDIEIGEGEFCVFVGPSGCGKSTLLRMIAGLESITGGDFELDGERMNDIAPDKRGIAMVFQSYALYPHMSVAENIGFSLELRKVEKAEIRRRVGEVAETLQLTPLLDRKPQMLSGGQRQRVAIGRAIIKQPRVILFDEPLSNLDASLRVQMRAELQSLHQRTGATIIYVTHDQVEAMTLADRIVVLEGGEIRQADAPIALYKRPRNAFVAQFIGSPRMNLFDARVTGRTADGLRIGTVAGWDLTLPGVWEVAEGTEVSLGIRPEDMAPADAGPSDIDTSVILSERLGMETFISFEVGGESGTARIAGDRMLAHGAPLRLRVDRAACHLFAADGTALAPAPDSAAGPQEGAAR